MVQLSLYTLLNISNTQRRYVNIIKCITGEPLDVQALLRTLDAEERVQVNAEVSATLDYQEMVQQGGKFVARPSDEALCRLLPAFNDMVRKQLPAKCAAPVLASEPQLPSKEIPQTQEGTSSVGAAEK